MDRFKRYAASHVEKCGYEKNDFKVLLCENSADALFRSKGK